MSEPDKSSGVQAGDDASRGSFSIQKIYIKDISFETPHSPDVFQDQWQPSVNMDLSNAARALDRSHFEVTLTVTVTVTSGGKTIYLVEVQQAGIFQVEGFAEDVINRLTGTSCPNILFPFAREMISDLVTRGGFPQLLLAPVNFEALYMQQQQQKQQQQRDEDSGTDKDTRH